MKLLLDTATFLWWITNNESLSHRARELVSDEENEVWFSVVSGWEIVIKTDLKRIRLLEKAERFLPKQVAINGFQVLPIHFHHALRVSALPALHRDPFDRLLVAQAIVEGLTIVTGDRQVAKYPAPVAW